MRVLPAPSEVEKTAAGVSPEIEPTHHPKVTAAFDFPRTRYNPVREIFTDNQRRVEYG
jgi:hypothetical protein